MRALTWHGKHDVRVDTVDDPEILNPRDAIIKITSTAICGSDLHLYDGYIPTMKSGDILGHEFMGEVVEVGSEITNLQKGDRVALMMPNLLQYPVALFGILRAGMIVVNVNPLYTPRELQHQLADSGAEAIVVLENVQRRADAAESRR